MKSVFACAGPRLSPWAGDELEVEAFKAEALLTRMNSTVLKARMMQRLYRGWLGRQRFMNRKAQVSGSGGVEKVHEDAVRALSVPLVKRMLAAACMGGKMAQYNAHTVFAQGVVEGGCARSGARGAAGHNACHSVFAAPPRVIICDAPGASLRDALIAKLYSNRYVTFLPLTLYQI